MISAVGGWERSHGTQNWQSLRMLVFGGGGVSLASQGKCLYCPLLFAACSMLVCALPCPLLHGEQASFIREGGGGILDDTHPPDFGPTWFPPPSKNAEGCIYCKSN